MVSFKARLPAGLKLGLGHYWFSMTRPHGWHLIIVNRYLLCGPMRTVRSLRSSRWGPGEDCLGVLWEEGKQVRNSSAGTDEATGAHVGVGRVRSNPHPWKLGHMPACPHGAGEQVGAGEAGPAQPAGGCICVCVSSPAGGGLLSSQV